MKVEEVYVKLRNMISSVAVKDDEFVKMDNDSDSKHLSELIDKTTIVNQNGVLKIKKLDGQEVTIAEINHLKGLNMNIVDLVKSFSNGGVKLYEHTIPTYADLLAMDRSSFIDGVRYFVYVLADETHGGVKTTYICDKANTSYFGVSGDDRDFTTEPIDLTNEVTGRLPADNMDLDALWLLLVINNTYKTLTSKNEVFGTHGAKNMYDELVEYIGNKANTSDLTNHTSDSNIHVTTSDKTKWNEVDNKVDKTDIVTSIGPMGTDSQVPSAKAMYDTLKITLIGSKQLSAYGKEIVKYPLGRWGTMGMGVKNLTDLPNDDVKYVEILGISDSATPWTVGLSTRTYRATTEDGAIFTRSITSGEQGGVIEKDTGWQKVCYTKIPDVPVTKITITDKTNYNNLYSAQLSYCVVSGICYISGGVECLTPPQGNVQIATLPKPSMGYQYFRTICTNTSKIEDIDHVRYMIGLNGEFRLIKGLAGGEYRGTFSYPVAES